MTNSRNKGAEGEREVARILRKELGIDVHRNWQAQAAGGGADILIPGWAVEVKRAKVLRIAPWWTQAAIQANSSGLRPVLIYRPDRGNWRALMAINDLRPDLRCPHQVDMALECWCEIYRTDYQVRHPTEC